MVTKLIRPGYTRISWRSLIFFSQFRCCTRNVPPSIWRAEPGLSTSIPLVSSDFLLYKMKRTCSDDSVEGASERIRKWTVKRMISTLAFFTDSSLLRTFSSYCTSDRAHHVPEEHRWYTTVTRHSFIGLHLSVCLSSSFPLPLPPCSPSSLFNCPFPYVNMVLLEEQVPVVPVPVPVAVAVPVLVPVLLEEHQTLFYCQWTK